MNNLKLLKKALNFLNSDREESLYCSFGEKIQEVLPDLKSPEMDLNYHPIGVDILYGNDEGLTDGVISINGDNEFQHKKVALKTPNRIRSGPNVVLHLESECGKNVFISVLFHKGDLYIRSGEIGSHLTSAETVFSINREVIK